jgi:hypothetical protein
MKHMNNLPTGTVTFLFTDIEGSTKLAQQHPDAMPVLLARHHEILIGEKSLKSNTMYFLGILARDEGDLPQAQSYAEALKIAKDVGSRRIVGFRLSLLG